MDHPPGITATAEVHNGENVRILSIEARSEYNGTFVDCVAVSLNESEEISSQASMVIQGNSCVHKLIISVLMFDHTKQTYYRTSRCSWKLKVLYYEWIHCC